MTNISRQDLVALDSIDPLAGFRDQFDLPDGIIYLDGNSLGALPRASAERIAKVVHEEWGQDLIKSWNVHDWFSLPSAVGDKIGRLVGAAPGQMVCADSTSVNIFKLMIAGLQLRSDRKVIVSERANFPTDLYIAQGVNDLLGGDYDIRLIDGPADLDREITDDVAMVMLTHVNYQSGRMYDIAGITAKAHDHGALMLWDLAHSAGAVPVDLDGCDVDFAVGCGYKYLNGGPGAPAFLYVTQRLQGDVRPPLSGWMGHEAPFLFDTDYRPADGIVRNLCGTPGVIAMSSLDASLDVILDADVDRIRTKSLALGDAFIKAVEQECGEFGFNLASPRDETRGSQVSFAHPDGYPIMQALIAAGIVGDFRAPNLLRFGFTPLYTRYVDIWDAVVVLKDIMASGRWDAEEFHRRAAVT